MRSTANTDHRGTAEYPGRVVTLEAKEGAVTVSFIISARDGGGFGEERSRNQSLYLHQSFEHSWQLFQLKGNACSTWK